MKKIFFAISVLICSNSYSAVDYKNIFSDRDGCFIITDLATGKIVDEYNSARCKKRFSPYSTFKVSAALMAFEKGVFKDENHIVKWDGVKRDRTELNQDLTPLTFMSLSAKWVTEWIMPQIGKKDIKSFLHSFHYGNEDFSGGMKNAWVSSSLKISAQEQVSFIANFWNGKLGLSDRTTELTKKTIFVKKLGKNTELYGKTGTGCIGDKSCMSRPGKMLGWFVGVVKSDSKLYAFAGNAADLKPQGPPGGARMREATVEIIRQMGLITE